MGIPLHSFDGLPDGIGKPGAACTSVGGTDVFVGIFVGSGVLVEVGKLVSVGTGVSVGLGAIELQDANTRISTESNITLPKFFIFSHFYFDVLVSPQLVAILQMVCILVQLGILYRCNQITYSK